MLHFAGQFTLFTQYLAMFACMLWERMTTMNLLVSYILHIWLIYIFLKEISGWKEFILPVVVGNIPICGFRLCDCLLVQWHSIAP